MCGILGIDGFGDISRELVLGLTTLQHRGQDAAGIVTLDQSFRLKKGVGLVREVFQPEDLARLAAPMGIGHVRYATQGHNDLFDAQPYSVNYPFGLAMAHNGNVINFSQLRRRIFEEHHRLLETSTDLELIVYTLASELERCDPSHLTPERIFEAVEATQRRVIGAYSTVTIIAGRGMLAFADPYGIRPLVLGQKQTPQGIAYAFASETACFDCLGYRRIRDLEPGEAIFLDRQRRIHSRLCHRQRQAFCVFEYLYFAREDSQLRGRLVAGERVKLGRRLAETFRATGLEPDIVIDVPSSAYFFASGLAEELGIPYRRGLAKNAHVGRSFIAPTQDERDMMVRQKLNPITPVVSGKKVAVLDDSIVRGTTSRHIVRMLRESGAREVYFVSASPPVRHPCIYGIDMSLQREMVAAAGSLEQVAGRIGADAVVYQPLSALQQVYADLPCCYACFSGEYPIPGSEEFLAEIERERECSKMA